MRFIGLTPCPDQGTIKMKEQLDQATSMIQSQDKTMAGMREVIRTPLLILG
jgi:hypothetical protein